LIVQFGHQSGQPTSLVLSTRATSISCVFDARSSHQPSRDTRNPSIRLTCPPCASSLAATSSITARLRSAATESAIRAC
jgi:hypothetical protein